MKRILFFCLCLFSVHLHAQQNSDTLYPDTTHYRFRVEVELPLSFGMGFIHSPQHQNNILDEGTFLNHRSSLVTTWTLIQIRFLFYEHFGIYGGFSSSNRGYREKKFFAEIENKYPGNFIEKASKYGGRSTDRISSTTEQAGICLEFTRKKIRYLPYMQYGVSKGKGGFAKFAMKTDATNHFIICKYGVDQTKDVILTFGCLATVLQKSRNPDKHFCIITGLHLEGGFCKETIDFSILETNELGQTVLSTQYPIRENAWFIQGGIVIAVGRVGHKL